jgi:hypothetical protein
MQRNSKTLKWTPMGVSDTLDSGDTFSGAMASLQNLIPDPTTRGLWQCRPASLMKYDFNGSAFSSGFSSGFGPPFHAGFISLLKIIGNVAYGLVASNTNPGHDQPFALNLITNTAIPVSGITSGNTPASPATSGAWTPPSADLVGALLVVTHPGFTGVGGVYFGWFDVSNPAAPVWHGGNLTGLVTFTTVPNAVKQFNGRAYFIQNTVAQPAVVFTDSLTLHVTNANQVLTFGDNVALTALGVLPLQNQLGGIIQGLMVFKGAQNIYQITGDAALSNLTVNSLNTATGTLAPNTVCQTPKGVAFISPDGLRTIDQYARVSDPIGIDGQGITVPFIFSNTPSRMVAACNGTVLRITTQNAQVAGTPYQEWWYDLARQRWHGPHTFPAVTISAWNATFIMSAVGVDGTLFQSDSVQSNTSTYVENGVQLNWNAQTSVLPDLDQMTFNCMTETTWDMALSSAAPALTIQALSDLSDVADSVSVAPAGGGTIWGTFQWGAAPWSGANNNLAARNLFWHEPLVFDRIILNALGQSASGLKVGTIRMRYQVLRQLYNPVFDLV